MPSSVIAREQMERRIELKLPRLIELLLSRPLVSTTMIQKELKVSRQGANFVAEFTLSTCAKSREGAISGVGVVWLFRSDFIGLRGRKIECHVAT